ncbi:MAG: DMT family transporter [Cyanobacteria bacterium P01_A01_bin.84]
MHQTSGNWRLGLALSVLTVCLWGVLPIALTITLQVLDVFTITWFRFTVAFVLLATLLATKGNLPSFSSVLSVWKLLTVAIIFLAVNYLLFLKGLSLTSPGSAQVFIQLAPFIMGLGGLFVFKERYSIRQWVGVSVLIVGFCLFFHEKIFNLVLLPNNYFLGIVLIVIAAISWAIYALAQKQLLHSLSSSQIMLIIYGGCAFLFMPFMVGETFFTLSYFHLGVLSFCALNTLIAYGAFAEALEHWEASKVSAILSSTPIVTLSSVALVSTIFPRLISGENLNFIGVLGATFVVSGSIIVALGKNNLYR